MAEQPRSSRDRESVRLSNPDIFSDDFALAPLEVAGRHRTSSPDLEGNHDATSETSRRSFTLQQALESPIGSFRRSGGSQRSDEHSSTTSVSEDRTSRFSNLPRSVTSVSDSGNTANTQHRSIRTISTFGFPRAQSPYQGATGPSQPYGMYPQDTGLMRTPSTATTSTIRQPERSYSGPSGPTQPYGMYAQNTVAEDDTDVMAGLALPNVAGIPSSHQNYQRRLGPDREDADDLIGPDGYTEQLPPYSRYANGIPPKYTSGVGSISRRCAPPAPLEESQETLNSPQSRDSGLVNPFGDSSTQLSSANSVAVLSKDEGGNFKEKVKRRSKRKVCCGVSCWLCFAIVVVVFLAVLLGGIIGGVVAHKRGEEKGKQESIPAQTVTAAAAAPAATVTQISPPPDAVSLSSTPTSLPPLQAGTFAVTLDQPSLVTNSCLTDYNQVAAWDCATGALLSMEVVVDGPQAPLVSLSYPSPTNSPIRYGAQPPELNGQASLVLMGDREASNRGPAYIFAQQYNKTVIVHNADIPGGLPDTPDTSNSKRSFIDRWFSTNEVVGEFSGVEERDNTYDSQWKSNSIAQPGDKPWYCYWPGTVLEGFIFVTQDAEQSGSGSEDGYSATSSHAAFPTPSGIPSKRQAVASLQPYPKMVKIEERRNIFNTQPYCQQMQILDNGTPGLLRYEASGELVTTQLNENEAFNQRQVNQQPDFDQWVPGSQPQASASSTNSPIRRRTLEKRQSMVSQPFCRCEWMSSS